MNRIADARAGEARLVAEVDRAVRYRRPVTLALVRIPDEAVADAVANELRAMDLLAEDAGDDYLLILPELDRAAGEAAVATVARGCAFTTALAPDDGTSVDELVALLRAGRTPTPRSDKLRALPTANMRGQLAEIERGAIVAALEVNQGNQTRTAHQLGLSRRALIYKMEKYGLKPPARGG